MTSSVKVDQIVTYLKTIGAITALVPGGIYFGEPIRERTEGTYLVLNIISQVGDFVDKEALVEIRVVGISENTTKASLVSIINTISDYLVTTNTFQILKLGTFSVYKIVEGGTFRVFVDEKDRNLLIKDYIFYFLQ